MKVLNILIVVFALLQIGCQNPNLKRVIENGDAPTDSILHIISNEKYNPDGYFKFSYYEGKELLLSHALREGRQEIFEKLIADGVNPNLPSNTKDKKSVIHYTWNKEQFLLIMKNGLKLSSPLIDKAELLHSFSWSIDEYKMLQDSGFDISQKLYSSTLLMKKRKGITKDILDFLIQYVDIDAVDSEGNTALIYAISNNNHQYAKLLLEAGANPSIQNNEGKASIHFCRYDSTIELLANHGADLLAKDKQGNTGLAYAIEGRQAYSTIPLFIKAGLDINQYNDSGKTLMDYTAGVGSGGLNYRAVQVLLANGYNINGQNKEGQTILHRMPSLYLHLLGANLDVVDNKGVSVRASMMNYLPAYKLKTFDLIDISQDSLKILSKKFRALPKDKQKDQFYRIGRWVGNPVELPASINDNGFDKKIIDSLNHRPLILEYSSQYIDIFTLKYLAKLGYDLNIRDEYNNGLFHLYTRGSGKDDATLTLFLIKSGVDISSPNDKGETPLMRFIRKGYVASAIHLLEAGAAIKPVDKEGKSVVDIYQTFKYKYNEFDQMAIENLLSI